MFKYLLSAFIAFSAVNASAAEQTLELAHSLIAEAIHDKSVAEDGSNEIRIELTRGKDYLLSTEMLTLTLNGLDVNGGNGSFTAYVTMSNGQKLELKGRFAEITQIPALGRKMAMNEVISAKDIVYIEIDAKKAKRGYITSEEDLIGKSIRRAIAAGRPILPSSLTEEKVVRKNQLISVSYRNNALHIHDTATAMEDGAVGDFIRVKSSSDKIIKARVVSSGQAEIRAVQHYASN